MANNVVELFAELKSLREFASKAEERLLPDDASSLAYPSSEKHTDNMESRVASLEVHMQHVQSDLTELKVGQEKLASAVSDLRVQMANDQAYMVKAFADQSEKISKVATKGTVWTALATGGGIAIAVLGVFIAILTYLQAFPHSH